MKYFRVNDLREMYPHLKGLTVPELSPIMEKIFSGFRDHIEGYCHIVEDVLDLKDCRTDVPKVQQTDYFVFIYGQIVQVVKEHGSYRGCNGIEELHANSIGIGRPNMDSSGPSHLFEELMEYIKKQGIEKPIFSEG